MAKSFYPDPSLGRFALAVDDDGMLYKIKYDQILPNHITQIFDSAVYQSGTGSLLSIFWHLPIYPGGDNEHSQNNVHDLHEGDAG